MSAHYDHVAPAIYAFFESRGISMTIEPSGSADADLVSMCGSEVGEIKHAVELARDLHGYWRQWNSSQSFGGKTPDYKLTAEFSPAVDRLSSAAQGWVAVVYGQLRYYCRKHGRACGWLVFEDPRTYGSSLQEALFFLGSENKVRVEDAVAHDALAFVYVRFL